MIYPKLSRFFAGQSIINFKHGLEGADVDDKSTSYIIGDRAGPWEDCCDVSNLCHEMAHFIDRDKDILKKFLPSWGFSYGEYWEFGRGSGYAHQTGESTECEIRVFAYQYILLKSISINITPEDLLAPLRHVNSFYTYCVERNMHNKSLKEQLAVALQEMTSIVIKFTVDDFERAWWDRIEALDKEQNLINNFKEKSIN